jgi:serine-type D-Ala-D-Ala carboxypeptidase/endopeptidase
MSARLLTRGLTVAHLSLLPVWLGAQTAPAGRPPAIDPVAVRAAIIPRINDGTFTGLAAAWRDGDTLRTAAAGVTRPGGAGVDGQTRFHLGESGNVFTTALLAHLVVRGELSLDDLAQRFMPPPIRLPNRAGRAITLGDLAFHRSGLPSAPRVEGRTAIERLDRAVRRAPLQFDIGSRYAFSQLGIDLLGLALARHLRMPLSEAVQSRVLGPLRITDVMLLTSRASSGTDAIGHTAAGRPVADQIRVEGTWVGSVIGMTRFVAAASDTVNGPLASTFALMMRTRSPGPDPTLPVALGWRVLPIDGRNIYWHDAQDAPGFSGYMAVDPSRARAVTVLSNTSRAVDAIAGQLLLGRVPTIDAASPSPSGPRRSGPR